MRISGASRIDSVVVKLKAEKSEWEGKAKVSGQPYGKTQLPLIAK